VRRMENVEVLLHPFLAPTIITGVVVALSHQSANAIVGTEEEKQSHNQGHDNQPANEKNLRGMDEIDGGWGRTWAER
jgi:hypothetical protein